MLIVATHMTRGVRGVATLSGWLCREEYGDANTLFRHDHQLAFADTSILSIFIATIAEHDVSFSLVCLMFVVVSFSLVCLMFVDVSFSLVCLMFVVVSFSLVCLMFVDVSFSLVCLMFVVVSFSLGYLFFTCMSHVCLLFLCSRFLVFGFWVLVKKTKKKQTNPKTKKTEKQKPFNIFVCPRDFFLFVGRRGGGFVSE